MLPKNPTSPQSDNGESSRSLQRLYDFVNTDIGPGLRDANPTNLTAPVAHWGLADAGQRYLFYITGSDDIKIDLRADESSFAVCWFNPLTGKRATQASAPIRGSQWLALRTPDKGRWLLWLEKM